MNSSIFVPKTINVGYQNRSGTYTGKLAYVIYYDEKGKLRKEASWNSWRDDKIPNDEFENVPTEGFVLNKKAGDYSTGWNHRHAYCRVYDPRGFEFEITIENLLYILENANCIKGKGLEGEFIYGWDSKDLVLMPVESPDYKQISEYSKIIHDNNAIKVKDLIVGATYFVKGNENWIYMGRYETYGHGYEFIKDGKTVTSPNYKDIPIGSSTYGTKASYKRISNFAYGKMHWFARLDDGKYKFEQYKSLPKNKIVCCIDDKCTSNYSEIYDSMESTYKFSPIDNSKDKIIDIPFEDFYKKAIYKYYDGDETIKYKDVTFMANVNGKCIKYIAITPYRSKDNGKYTVYRYIKSSYDKKEEIDVFPTEEKDVIGYYGQKMVETHMIPVPIEIVFEKLKPVCKQKYLENGRECIKKYEFNE